MSARAFTLIELLLVIALILVVAVPAFATGLTFYRVQTLDDTTHDLLSNLRKAQAFAISGKHDSSFGIKVLEGEYVLFEGDTFQLRNVDEDERHAIPFGTSIEGFDELLFGKLSGAPSDALTIVVRAGEDEATVWVSGNGVISH